MCSTRKDSNLDIHSLDFANVQFYHLIMLNMSIISFHIDFKFTTVTLMKFQPLKFVVREFAIYWHFCALDYQVSIFITNLLIC